MIVIGANKKNIYYRALILVVLWLFLIYFYSNLVWKSGNFLEIINLIGIALATLYFTPLAIVTILFSTVKVTLTPDSLQVFRILSGTQTLPFSAIDHFSTQSFFSANGRHERVTINYSNTRTLKIADINVESILPLLEALRDKEIRYTGHTEEQSRFTKRQG